LKAEKIKEEVTREPRDFEFEKDFVSCYPIISRLRIHIHLFFVTYNIYIIKIR
jgi:hypothetical protein